MRDLDPIFIGRAPLLESVVGWIEQADAVVTLTGGPGVGKSRLALRAVDRLEAKHQVTVCWLDAEGLEDAPSFFLAFAAALALPMPDVAEAQGLEQLTGALKAQTAPVVVVDGLSSDRGVRDLLRALVSRTRARWLLTTRESLGLKLEQRLEVPPLDDRHAEELFLVRARKIEPGFRLRPSDRVAMDALLTQLDGIPLAVEMAASRVNALSLEQLAQRFLRLESDAGLGPSALDHVLDSSWNSLSPLEQMVARRGSILRGGFTLATAEALMEGSSEAPLDQVLHDLREKSILRLTPIEEDGSPRFILPRLVAHRARRALETAGEVDTARERAARHLVRSLDVPRLASVAHGVGGRRGQEDLERELDNLVDLCSQLEHEPELAARCGLAASYLVYARGPGTLARTLMERTVRLAEASGDPVLLARARVAGCAIAREWFAEVDLSHGLHEALAEAERAGEAELAAEASILLALIAAEGPEEDRGFEEFERARSRARGTSALTRAFVDGHAGHVLVRSGQFERAAKLYDSGIAATSVAGAARLEAVLRRARAVCRYEAGGLAEFARDEHRRTLELQRAIADRLHEPLTLANLGELEYVLGREAEGFECIDESERLIERVGVLKLQGLPASFRGWLHLSSGSFEAAAEAFSEGIARSRRAWPILFPRCLGGLAIARLGLGDHSQAQALFEETLQARAQLGRRFDESPIELGLLAYIEKSEGVPKAAPDRLREAMAIVERQESLRLSASLAMVEAATLDQIEIQPAAEAQVFPVIRALGHILNKKPPEPQLQIDVDARTVILPDGQLVDLRRRPMLARLIFALADGQCDQDALISEVWPDDKSGHEALSNRLWVAMSSLRKLGFEELIEKTDTGYRLTVGVGRQKRLVARAPGHASR